MAGVVGGAAVGVDAAGAEGEGEGRGGGGRSRSVEDAGDVGHRSAQARRAATPGGVSCLQRLSLPWPEAGPVRLFGSGGS